MKNFWLLEKYWQQTEENYGKAISVKVLARENVPFGVDYTVSISPDNLEKLTDPTIYLANDLNSAEIKAGLIFGLHQLGTYERICTLHQKAAQDLSLEEYIDETMQRESSANVRCIILITGSGVREGIFSETDFPLTLGIPEFDISNTPEEFNTLRRKQISESALQIHNLGIFKLKNI